MLVVYGASKCDGSSEHKPKNPHIVLSFGCNLTNISVAQGGGLDLVSSSNVPARMAAGTCGASRTAGAHRPNNHNQSAERISSLPALFHSSPACDATLIYLSAFSPISSHKQSFLSSHLSDPSPYQNPLTNVLKLQT
jgi:hypothetical protein